MPTFESLASVVTGRWSYTELVRRTFCSRWWNVNVRRTRTPAIANKSHVRRCSRFWR